MIDDAVVASTTNPAQDWMSSPTVNRPASISTSFYGYLEGIDLESAPPRRFGPPAHDQRSKAKIMAVQAQGSAQWMTPGACNVSTMATPPQGRVLVHATLSGRYYCSTTTLGDRKELIPIVRRELEELVAAGCTVHTVDERQPMVRTRRTQTVR